MDRNLVAVDREGTLINLSSYGRYMLLRPNIVGGIGRMAALCNVVLTTREGIRTAAHLTQHLGREGFSFAGVYTNLGTAVGETPAKSLFKLYEDFGVTADDIERRVLTIEDIPVASLYPEEAAEFIEVRRDAHFCRIAEYDGKVPIAVLVPHITLGNTHSEGYGVMRPGTGVLADIVERLYGLGQGDFLKGYDAFEMEGVIKADDGKGRRYLIIQGSMYVFPAEPWEEVQLTPRVLCIDASTGAASNELLEDYAAIVERGELDAALIQTPSTEGLEPLIAPSLMALVHKIRSYPNPAPVIIAHGSKDPYSIKPNMEALRTGAIQLGKVGPGNQGIEAVINALRAEVERRGTEHPGECINVEDRMLQLFGGWRLQFYR